MLLELHIAGLGVIDDLTLELSPGLNVLTGETGAGKTMITMALSLVTGGRGHAHLVRPGTDRARVEARFDAGGSAAAGEWAEHGELVLSRALGGRSLARAGGQLAPLSTLAELAAELLEIHGQNQTQRLLSPSVQLAYLDRFAGKDHLAAVAAYRATHDRLRAGRARAGRLDQEAREREREKDLLAHQVREIEGTALHPGELTELRAEEARLAHAERILKALAAARTALEHEGGGADALGIAAAAVADAASMDPGMAASAGRLTSLAEEARDAVADLRAYAESVAIDPERLERVRERLRAIGALERKYGEGEAGVLAYLDDARRRLALLEGSETERSALADEVAALAAEARELAERLTASRSEAGPRLGAALAAELRELGMEAAEVRVRIEEARGLGPDGAEGVELTFAGGPRQEPRPLSRVASGGELSRIMLACRTVLADLDRVPTIVFDEVDAGIGGRAGLAVGKRLAWLARRRQVLVVTHLPQIACFADRHFLVTKEGGTARVSAMEGAYRVGELARMLSGMPTEEAATHAEQLLASASREKAV